jgi:hypothetical protein
VHSRMREALADAQLCLSRSITSTRTPVRHSLTTARKRRRLNKCSAIMRAHSGKRDQGLLCASARRDGRNRSGALRAFVGSAMDFADHQLSKPRSSVRSRRGAKPWPGGCVELRNEQLIRFGGINACVVMGRIS